MLLLSSNIAVLVLDSLELSVSRHVVGNVFQL